MLHAYAKGRPALLLCPPAKSRKSEDGIELFGCSILEEMEEVSYIKNQKQLKTDTEL